MSAWSIHLRQNYEFFNRKSKRCAIWTVWLIWNVCLKSFLRLKPFALSVKKKKIKSACCLRYGILTHSILTHILHVKVSSMTCFGCNLPFLSVQKKRIIPVTLQPQKHGAKPFLITRLFQWFVNFVPAIISYADLKISHADNIKSEETVKAGFV